MYWYCASRVDLTNTNISTLLVVPAASELLDMFNGASSFNQDISSWNLTSAVDLSGMFDGASAFSQVRSCACTSVAMAVLFTDFLSRGSI